MGIKMMIMYRIMAMVIMISAWTTTTTTTTIEITMDDDEDNDDDDDCHDSKVNPERTQFNYNILTVIGCYKIAGPNWSR